MKKLAVLFIVALFLTACNPKDDPSTSPQPEQPSVDSESPAPTNAEWISAVESVDTSGLDVLWESELDNGAKVTIYLDGAAWDENGKFLGYETDHQWMLIYESSDGIYPLFPRKQLSHSVIKCEVFIDNNGNFDTLHVLVWIERGGLNTLFDCVWDKDKKAFERTTLYDKFDWRIAVSEW